MRLRLVATKGGAPFQLRGEDGKYLPDVLLDLDYWALMPLCIPPCAIQGTSLWLM
jgi:2-methylfumaryl-CoA hydratase